MPSNRQIYAGSVSPNAAAAVALPEIPRHRRRGRRLAKQQTVFPGQIATTGQPQVTRDILSYDRGGTQPVAHLFYSSTLIASPASSRTA